MAKKRRKPVKRYSREWPASHKRYAKRIPKGVDNTGNTAARNLDRQATNHHTMTHTAVTSLTRRITSTNKPQPPWVKALANNARQWLTENTHLDTFTITTLTKRQLAHLDSIQAERTR
jgi:hypothetical protein